MGFFVAWALWACGGAPSGGTGAVSVPPLEQRFPALRWVPADATWVVTGRVSDMSLALRELVTPTELLSFGVAPAERFFRVWFATNPMDANELARIGIAVDRTAAAFSTGVFPTIAVPVENADAMQAFLDANRPAQARMRERAGATLVTWRATESIAMGYARIDDWVLVHVGDAAAPGAPGGDDAWFDAALAARGRGIAGEPDLAAAADAARRALGGDGPPQVLGLLRPAALARAAGPSACGDAAARAVARVTLGIDVDARAGRAWLGAALSSDAADAVRAAATPAPPAAYRAYRDAAGLYVDLAVDAPALVEQARAAGCELPGDPGLLFREMRASGVRGFHAAIRRLLLDRLDLEAAAYASLSDRRAIDALLDRIPGRSLVERSVDLGGGKARSIDLGVVPRFVYRLTAQDVLAAVGSAAIETAFGAATEAGESPLRLAALGVRPDKMPDLDATLAVVFEQVAYGEYAAAAVARLLSRYREAALAIELSDDTVALRGWMQLAP